METFLLTGLMLKIYSTSFRIKHLVALAVWYPPVSFSMDITAGQGIPEMVSLCRKCLNHLHLRLKAKIKKHAVKSLLTEGKADCKERT